MGCTLAPPGESIKWFVCSGDEALCQIILTTCYCIIYKTHRWKHILQCVHVLIFKRDELRAAVLSVQASISVARGSLSWGGSGVTSGTAVQSSRKTSRPQASSAAAAATDRLERRRRRTRSTVVDRVGTGGGVVITLLQGADPQPAAWVVPGRPVPEPRTQATAGRQHRSVADTGRQLVQE